MPDSDNPWGDEMEAKYQSATSTSPDISSGRTSTAASAGQYSRAEAIHICRDALLSSAEAGVIAEILHLQTVADVVLGAKLEWRTCG